MYVVAYEVKYSYHRWLFYVLNQVEIAKNKKIYDITGQDFSHSVCPPTVDHKRSFFSSSQSLAINGTINRSRTVFLVDDKTKHCVLLRLAIY